MGEWPAWWDLRSDARVALCVGSSQDGETTVAHEQTTGEVVLDPAEDVAAPTFAVTPTTPQRDIPVAAGSTLPLVGLSPGNPVGCPPAFSFRVSGSGTVTAEERENFKRLLRAAICSDRPPPAQGCLTSGHPCWEISYN